MRKKKCMRNIAAIGAVILFAVIISVYYKNNICIEDGCYEKRFLNYEYCAEHRLSYTESKNYAYTTRRICNVTDCSKERVSGGSYCSSHTCSKSGCYVRIFDNGGYCYEHKLAAEKSESASNNASGSGGTSSGTSKSSVKSKSDPYNASKYVDPEDFYYDYYDDFFDFEDAEDYWRAHK